VTCMVARGPAAAAAPLDAMLLPAAPLAADGVRTHLLRLYFVDHDALVSGLPTVRAGRGSIVGAPIPIADGGVALRYRPPRIATPSSDTLTVALHGRERALAVALEPSGRVTLALEVPPGPLLLGHGAATTLKLSVRDAAGRPTRAALRLGASIGRVGDLR